MAADFEVPSVEELRDRGLRSLNAEFPELRTGTGTPARLEMSAWSRVVADNHVHIGAVDADANPLTASEAGLQRWADLVGVPRKPATGARRSAALEIRGAAGSVVSAGAQLQHQTRLLFQVSTTITIPASGFAYADVEAIDTGPNTRLKAGEALRFLAAPAGVEPSARLVLALTEGGEPLEPVGAWRARVVARFQQTGQGGNRQDYGQWVLEATPAVRDAYVYGAKPGLGFVSVAGLREGEGPSRVLSASERSAIAAYLETKRPISDQVVVLETIARKVNVDIRIETLASAAFDWDDTGAYQVLDYVVDTGVLEMTPGVPADMSPGDLLVIASVDPATSGADGYPAVVSAVLDATRVVLAPFGDRSAPLSWLPGPGDDVYASSVTAFAVRQAIVNGYTIGCGLDAVAIPGINQLGPANPDHAYGDWESDIDVGRLAAAALSVTGVVRPVVMSPAVDEEAEEFAFPDTDQVELLIPGQILVRSL